MIAFGITVTVLLMIFGQLFGKKKVIYFLQCLWLWVIQAFNCGGMDYAINEIIYKNGGVETEWFANLVIKFFLDRNIDYMWYRAFWATICIVIMGSIVWKYCKHPCVAINLYYIFLWSDSTAQCRFFWMMCIILLAFSFMIKGKMAAYYMLCLIATGMHTSAFIYLFFPILSKIAKKGSTAGKILILIAEVIFFLNIVNILNAVGMTYAAEKFTHYLYEDTYSSIAVGICFVIVYAVFIYCLYWILNHSGKNERTDAVLYDLLNVAIFILPFLLFNSNFARYFRPIFILGYIVIANRESKCQFGNVSSVATLIFCGTTMLLATVLQYKTNWLLIDTIFNHNYVLQVIF